MLKQREKKRLWKWVNAEEDIKPVLPREAIVSQFFQASVLQLGVGGSSPR